MISHLFSDQSLAWSDFNRTISSGISFPFSDTCLLIIVTLNFLLFLKYRGIVVKLCHSIHLVYLYLTPSLLGKSYSCIHIVLLWELFWFSSMDSRVAHCLSLQRFVQDIIIHHTLLLCHIWPIALSVSLAVLKMTYDRTYCMLITHCGTFQHTLENIVQVW